MANSIIPDTNDRDVAVLAAALFIVQQHPQYTNAGWLDQLQMVIDACKVLRAVNVQNDTGQIILDRIRARAAETQ